MSSTNAGNTQADQARQVLCDQIARCMRAKRYSVRVRIAESDGNPVEANFYSHGDHGWQKEPQSITDGPLVGAMNETLEMLSSKAHHDTWTARRQLHAHGHDVDLQFHPEKLKDHFGDKLETALLGLLFRDQHDSKKDSRRNIRTPRPMTARK